MKAVEFQEYGPPHEVCHCVEVDDAPAPGPGEVTVAVAAVGKRSIRTISRPQCQYYDHYQPRRHHEDAISTRSRPRASTSPYGDGTSPTVPDGATARPRCAGRTSSRDQSGPVLVSIYPYPAHGGLGPVRGGPRGRRNNAFLCGHPILSPVIRQLGRG